MIGPGALGIGMDVDGASEEGFSAWYRAQK
jgi:hypothetical protein